jgi:hypothetical protein
MRPTDQLPGSVMRTEAPRIRVDRPNVGSNPGKLPRTPRPELYLETSAHVETNRGMLCAVANPNQLKCLAQGIEAWNEWRKRNRHSPFGEEPVDLSGADLREYDLRRVYLSRTNLRGSCLAGVSAAKFDRTVFTNGRLTRARATGSSFSKAGFVNATLDAIEFIDSELFASNFGGSDLRWARLVGCNALGSNWSGALMA